jgi:uncharacterized protein (DUF779 family)
MKSIAVERVGVTPEALTVIAALRKQYGPLMFHQSGGCCDGSSPMCFEEGEFRIGESDILLGRVENCPFYMSRDQYEYWKHTHLTLDVTKGRGSSFSLEIPMGIRFIIRSRLFNPLEMEHLKTIGVI